MNEEQELTDISKCGPAEPGKKWVQVKKTETGMTADGSFFSKDYTVWEQVADNKVKNVKQLEQNSLDKPMIQKRAPTDNLPKNKQVQKGLASFFTKK
jgi:hypothetical protein